MPEEAMGEDAASIGLNLASAGIHRPAQLGSFPSPCAHAVLREASICQQKPRGHNVCCPQLRLEAREAVGRRRARKPGNSATSPGATEQHGRFLRPETPASARKARLASACSCCRSMCLSAAASPARASCWCDAWQVTTLMRPQWQITPRMLTGFPCCLNVSSLQCMRSKEDFHRYDYLAMPLAVRGLVLFLQCWSSGRGVGFFALILKVIRRRGEF